MFRIIPIIDITIAKIEMMIVRSVFVSESITLSLSDDDITM